EADQQRTVVTGDLRRWGRRSGEGKRGHPGRRASRGRGGSIPWVGLLRGWSEMGYPRCWGAGGARGSPARVLSELGRGRSAKARPRSSSAGGITSLGVNSSYG